MPMHRSKPLWRESGPIRPAWPCGYRLPGLSGIEGVRLLHERYPTIAPVLLTVYKDDDRIFQAVCAGACGYLLKKTPPARLLEAVREIAGVARRCHRKWRFA